MYFDAAVENVHFAKMYIFQNVHFFSYTIANGCKTLTSQTLTFFASAEDAFFKKNVSVSKTVAFSVAFSVAFFRIQWVSVSLSSPRGIFLENRGEATLILIKTRGCIKGNPN